MQSTFGRLQWQIVEPGRETEEEIEDFSVRRSFEPGTSRSEDGAHRSRSVGGIICGCEISKVGLQGMRIAFPVSGSTFPPSKGWSGTTLPESLFEMREYARVRKG